MTRGAGRGEAELTAALTEPERRRISRERNPDDRREYLLRLTPEGHQQLAAARAVVDQAHQRLARQIGNAELGDLNALLTKITT